MNNKKITVTIGIPAYNEEANIGYLLKDILRQKHQYFLVTNIIISSDGSTDATKKVVDSFEDKRITFLDNKNRKGQASRQNQIMQMSSTDVLVLINADIVLINNNFLNNLLLAFTEKSADLISSKLITTSAKTVTGKILAIGFLFKTNIYEQYKSGNNLYTCHGAVRAFSKKMYKAMKFKQSVAEDAYSYLYAIKHNYHYEYAKQAIAMYKLPENMIDHKKQSTRFFQSKYFLYDEFGKDFVDREYRLPLKKTFITYLEFLLRHPLAMIVYLTIAVSMRLQALFMIKVSNTWDVAQSSKVIRNI